MAAPSPTLASPLADPARAQFDETASRFVPDLTPTVRVEPCPFAAGRRLIALLDGIEIGLSADAALSGERS